MLRAHRKPKDETFTPDSRRLPKNRRSQLVAIAAIAAIVVGGVWPSQHLEWLGIVLLVGGFAVLLGTMIWAIKNWEWER